MDKMLFESFVNENEDSLEEQILRDKEILSELKMLGVSVEEIQRYLPILIRHKESKDACKRCKSLDNCCSESVHLKTNLILSDCGGLTVQMGPCKYQEMQDKMVSKFIYSDFPYSWFSQTRKKTKRNVEIFNCFSEAISSTNKRWVYLNGDSGTGKTFLAVDFGKAIAKKGGKVAVINANSRFDEIKTYMIKNKDAAEKMMQDLSNVFLLIIDDFGTEYKSDYVRDQIVMPLLNARSKGKGITIFLSNYSIGEIESLYITTRNSAILANKLAQLIRNNTNGEYVLSPGLEGEMD